MSDDTASRASAAQNLDRMSEPRSSRDRKPAQRRAIEVPYMELASEGPAFLAEQLTESYRDSLDTQRLPAIRFDRP